ncbi:Rrp15p-domain-containing protein [Fimicolochytrium jonesii]|uniref:Rrp15p-domain-containing protein n=1 Tax=Fimicolochytrium jonesii TaxID=1396493 RepID=UPI0022FE1220|nr:Rrp15p-domain-containing protein [Fimicolochytrium jonesii]KAI8818359.1 Rrp15p-domain-containing protein [Fimicolochytrium jonesii]
MPPKRKAPQRSNPRDFSSKKRRIKPKHTQDDYVSPNEDEEEVADLLEVNDAELSSDDEAGGVVIEGLEALDDGGEGEESEDDEGADGGDFGLGHLDDGEEEPVVESEEEEEQGNVKSKSSKMANAIGKILAADLGGKDAQRPILAKQKHIERQIDNDKLEAKARKIISAERKQKADVGHVTLDHSTTDYEKRLKKVATRGVVKLFNAIRVAQKTAEETKLEGIQKNKDAAPVITKNTFMDMLKAQEKPAAGKGAETKAEEQKKTAAVTDAGPSWIKQDFMMKAPKHWDEEDEDEGDGDVV